MDIVDRAGWGGQQPRERTRQLRQVDQRGLAVHHSGSASEQRGDHGQCAGVMRAIQKYHQETRGWNDVAYNWLVCAHGHVFVGRGLGVRSAAQGTDRGNLAFHAVAWLGDGANFIPNQARVEALTWVRGQVLGYQRTARLVWPHLRFTSTTCPGRALREWCRQFPD